MKKVANYDKGVDQAHKSVLWPAQNIKIFLNDTQLAVSKILFLTKWTRTP